MVQDRETIRLPQTQPDQLPAPIIAPADDIEATLLDAAPWAFGLLAVSAMLALAIVIAVIRPEWISALRTSLAGATPHAFWYLSRSSGVVGFVLMWASMALGLAITNRMMRVWPGGPTIAALHEYVSVLGLVFVLFHVAILLFDGYSNYTLEQLLLPFASVNYRPFWVGMGQIAFYLLLPVTFTFYVRRLIGYRAFRMVHYLSFALFVMALVHGLYSGTDSGTMLMRDIYWGCGVSTLGLTVYRFALMRSPARAAA